MVSEKNYFLKRKTCKNFVPCMSKKEANPQIQIKSNISFDTVSMTKMLCKAGTNRIIFNNAKPIPKAPHK